MPKFGVKVLEHRDHHIIIDAASEAMALRAAEQQVLGQSGRQTLVEAIAAEQITAAEASSREEDPATVAPRAPPGGITIHDALSKTDWCLLARQKQDFVNVLTMLVMNDFTTTKEDASLHGLLNWIDGIQDAAIAEGYPVAWLSDNRGVIENRETARCQSTPSRSSRR